jgi:hypothetical protein
MGKNIIEEKEKKICKSQTNVGFSELFTFLSNPLSTSPRKLPFILDPSKQTSQYLLSVSACQYVAGSVVGASGLPLSPP